MSSKSTSIVLSVSVALRLFREHLSAISNAVENASKAGPGTQVSESLDAIGAFLDRAKGAWREYQGLASKPEPQAVETPRPEPTPAPVAVTLPDDAKALRAMCREHGLPDGGAVQGLQARLTAHLSKAAPKAPEAPKPAPAPKAAPETVVQAAAAVPPKAKPAPKAAAKAFSKAARRARGVVSIDLTELGTQTAPLVLFKAA
jgi:hypothetical protein